MPIFPWSFQIPWESKSMCIIQVIKGPEWLNDEQGHCCSRVLGTQQEDWTLLKPWTEDCMHITEHRSVLTVWPILQRWFNPSVQWMVGSVKSSMRGSAPGYSTWLFQGPGQCSNKVPHWPTWKNLSDWAICLCQLWMSSRMSTVRAVQW